VIRILSCKWVLFLNGKGGWTANRSIARGIACPGNQVQALSVRFNRRLSCQTRVTRVTMAPNDPCRFVRSLREIKCKLAAQCSGITVIVTEVKGLSRGNNLRVLRLRELQACTLILHEIDSTCRHVFTVRTTTYVRHLDVCYALILYSYGSRSV